MSYRETRYRVWDDNEMRPAEPAMVGSQKRLKSEKGVIMRSTGRTDREDTEIYEGDIVGWSPEGSSPMGTCVVEWIASSKRFGLRDRRSSIVWDFERIARSSDLHVRGNIYQHPELIAVAIGDRTARPPTGPSPREQHYSSATPAG